MQTIESNYRQKSDLEGAPVDFERGFFNKGESVKHDRIKSDVWSLGMCMLYSGNLRSVQEIYDFKDFKINEEALTEHLEEFSQRFKKEDPKLVECVTKMLKISESERPTFAELKKEYCPDLELREKAEDDYEFEVVQDPFKQQMKERQRQMELQRQRMTQKQLEELNMKRLSEHPIHGGVFGKHMQRGKKRFGHTGVGHGTLTLKQAKILDSMDYVHPRNNQYLSKNLDYQSNLANQKMSAQTAGSRGYGRMDDAYIVNRRYFH